MDKIRFNMLVCVDRLVSKGRDSQNQQLYRGNIYRREGRRGRPCLRWTTVSLPKNLVCSIGHDLVFLQGYRKKNWTREGFLSSNSITSILLVFMLSSFEKTRCQWVIVPFLPFWQLMTYEFALQFEISV